MTRLSAWLVRLHPPAWRARYGDEMQAMLEGRRLSTREAVDLLRSAVREQLWPTVGNPSGRRAVIARLLTTALLTYVVFVLFNALLLSVVHGRFQWPTPLWITFYLDSGSALVRVITFWWAPTLAAIAIAAVCRRIFGRAVWWSAATSVLLTAVVGLAVAIVVHGGPSRGWLLVSEPARIIRLWPRLAVIAVGSGAIGFVVWWIGAAPMRAPVSVEVAEGNSR